MNKILIFSAYANVEGVNSSVNINKVTDRHNVYYRNIIVALVSAKRNNPEVDVAMITNTDVPNHYQEILKQNEIMVIHCPFDSFRFRDDYPWALAFYKLCALKELLKYNYHNYLMIDSDVFVQNSLDMLWNWTSDYLVVLDTDESTERWQNEMQTFLGTEVFIPHWGGEFIAGSKTIIQQFINDCSTVFDRMIQNDFTTIHGDEFIESVVIHNGNFRVKHAGNFVYRFWTRTDYRVKTVLPKGGISVLHVPAEKQFGMLRIYEYINKYRNIPSQSRAQKMLHLHRPSIGVFAKRLYMRLKQTIKNG